MVRTTARSHYYSARRPSSPGSSSPSTRYSPAQPQGPDPEHTAVFKTFALVSSIQYSSALRSTFEKNVSCGGRVFTRPHPDFETRLSLWRCVVTRHRQGVLSRYGPPWEIVLSTLEQGYVCKT